MDHTPGSKRTTPAEEGASQSSQAGQGGQTRRGRGGPQGPIAVEVSGLVRHFGPVKAVDQLDLTAARGQVTALVGPNGSGKTTLLLMLATLLTPDAGSMRIAGLDPVTQPREVRRVMGWMPDGFGTWDTLTVREVLQTVAAAYQLPAAAIDARVAELIHLVHLEELADRPARVLSRGQKQRLGLARAIIHDPQVLLLDEPASGLDPRSRVELRDIIRALASRGCAVIISSHILVELEEMADRAVVISGGRAVATHEVTAASATTAWRITTLDVTKLRAALTARGITATDVPMPSGEWSQRAALDVAVGDEREAAALLETLVGQGVPIFGFAPQLGGLESAYLAATGERR